LKFLAETIKKARDTNHLLDYKNIRLQLDFYYYYKSQLLLIFSDLCITYAGNEDVQIETILAANNFGGFYIKLNAFLPIDLSVTH